MHPNFKKIVDKLEPFVKGGDKVEPFVKGGDKVFHCGGGIVYHRHDEKELNWEPRGVRSRGPQFRSESGVVRLVRDLGGNSLCYA